MTVKTVLLHILIIVHCMQVQKREGFLSNYYTLTVCAVVENHATVYL